MRIRGMTVDLYYSIALAYEGSKHTLTDSWRGAFDEFLLDRPDIFWYQGPTDESFVFADRTFGGTVYIIAPDFEPLFRKRRRFLKLMKYIMRDLEVYRVSAVVPSSSEKLHKLLIHTGFKHEGRVRKLARYDEEWSDVEIFGLLFDEVEKKAKRRRRKKKEAAGVAPETGGPPEETTEKI